LLLLHLLTLHRLIRRRLSSRRSIPSPTRIRRGSRARILDGQQTLVVRSDQIGPAAAGRDPRAGAVAVGELGAADAEFGAAFVLVEAGIGHALGVGRGGYGGGVVGAFLGSTGAEAVGNYVVAVVVGIMLV